MFMRMQDFGFYPNLIKFYTIYPNLSKFYPNFPNFTRICPNFFQICLTKIARR